MTKSKTNFQEENAILCPINLAGELIGSLSNATIIETCKMIGFRENEKTAFDWISYYLQTSCTCLKNSCKTSNKAVLTCIANVFMTLGLNITAFENYVLYFGDFNHGSCPEEIDEIWAKAKEMPIGTTCLLCCGKDFDNKQTKNCCTRGI